MSCNFFKIKDEQKNMMEMVMNELLLTQAQRHEQRAWKCNKPKFYFWQVCTHFI